MKLKMDEIETPIGTLRVAALEDVLCAVGFADQWAALAAALQQRFGEVRLERQANPGGATSRLAAYFVGDLSALDDLRVDAGGTAFQRKVWAALRTIPPGRTASYSDVAKAIGSRTAVRAVGAANGSNPISIVVPCHRVIGADGRLCGYGGGIERKRWLLQHERAVVASCRIENAIHANPEMQEAAQSPSVWLVRRGIDEGDRT